MTISSSLNAGVAGLNVNASRLATISDNIANSSTFGYKRAVADFHSLVIHQGAGSYSAGGVRVTTHRMIDQRGTLITTDNPTDLAIGGRGMLPVAEATQLTIAGSPPVLLTTTGTGVTEFTLNPPELGRLRMVISNSEAGAMSLTILADRPEVADLMRRHSQILVQEFMREGLNHTAIKIEASAPAAQTATPTVPQASSGPQGLNLWADAHAQGQNPQRQNPQSHHNQQDRPVPDEPRSVVGAGVDARAIMVAAAIPTTRTLDLRL